MENRIISKRINSILSASTFEKAVLEGMEHAANEADTSIAGYLSNQSQNFWKDCRKDLKNNAIGRSRRNALINLISFEPNTKAYLQKLYRTAKNKQSVPPIYIWKSDFETTFGYSFNVSEATIDTFEIARSEINALFQQAKISDYEAFDLMIGLADAANKKAQRLSLKNSFWRITLKALHDASKFAPTREQFAIIVCKTDITISESGTIFKSEIAHHLLCKLRLEALIRTNTYNVLNGDIFWRTKYAQEQLKIIKNALEEADKQRESKILGYDGPVRTTGLFLSAQQRVLVDKNFDLFVKDIDEAIKIDDQEFETREWVLFDLEAKAMVSALYGKEDDYESAINEHNRQRLNSNIQLKHREESMFQIHKQKKAH